MNDIKCNEIDKFFELFSSELLGDNYQPSNALCYENDNNFQTIGKEENEYFLLHFKYHKLYPSKYRLKSCNVGSGHAHMKSWYIEGSKNGIVWEEISRVENDTIFNDARVENDYPFNKTDTWYSYFKIVHIESHNPSFINRLAINDFELYGRRLLLFPFTLHCKHNKNLFIGVCLLFLSSS